MLKPGFSHTSAPTPPSVKDADCEFSAPKMRLAGRPERPALNYRRYLAIAAGCLTLVGAVSAAVINHSHSGIQAKATDNAVLTVTIATPTLKTVDDSASLTGSVSAWDPLSIGSEVSGLRIQSVEVEEGDTVKKGQVLARLNSSVLQAQLDQTKARLASGQANLKKSVQPIRQEDIAALQAALAEAQANTAQESAHHKQLELALTTAEINAGRYAELARQGAVSVEDSANKQLAVETARDGVLSSHTKVQALKALEDQARDHLLAAQRGGRREDVDISKASLAETRAQVQQLEEQIKQTLIAAPDDGMISKRDAHIGDIAATGTPLFSMIRLNRLELRAEATDIELSKFHVGQTVAVSSTEDAQSQIKGTVSLVSAQVDPTTRLGMVHIQLPSDCGLKPGMFVRGEVKLATRSALTVPIDAVVFRNGESFLFALNGDRATSLPVKVGVQTDTFAEILSGLSPKQKVIVKGARFLSDRDIVRVGI